MQDKAVFSVNWLTNVTQEPNERALTFKPEKHDFIIKKNVKPYMTRFMNITGG